MQNHTKHDRKCIYKNLKTSLFKHQKLWFSKKHFLSKLEKIRCNILKIKCNFTNKKKLEKFKNNILQHETRS